MIDLPLSFLKVVAASYRCSGASPLKANDKWLTNGSGVFLVGVASQQGNFIFTASSCHTSGDNENVLTRKRLVGQRVKTPMLVMLAACPNRYYFEFFLLCLYLPLHLLPITSSRKKATKKNKKRSSSCFLLPPEWLIAPPQWQPSRHEEGVNTDGLPALAAGLNGDREDGGLYTAGVGQPGREVTLCLCSFPCFLFLALLWEMNTSFVENNDLQMMR